jgi:hypothetical protein
VLAGVLLLVAQASFPDLTVTTRATTNRPDSAVETRTVQIKGQRQRHTFGIEIRDRHFQSGFSAQISQCDLHRGILLNDAAKIYGIVPMRDRTALLRARAIGAMPPADNRPVVQTITIDARDTGERRKVGPLDARHVVTTWKTDAADAALNETRVQDGWYVDLPAAADCQGRVDAFLVSGPANGRTEVKRRGTARTGFPIEETDCTVTPSVTIERRLRLVAVSEASLPDSLFEIPADYRPALPRFDGGVDMQRPDTWANRAVMAWETASAWVRQWWR